MIASNKQDLQKSASKKDFSPARQKSAKSIKSTRSPVKSPEKQMSLKPKATISKELSNHKELNKPLEPNHVGDVLINDHEKIDYSLAKPRFNGKLSDSQMIHPLYAEYYRLYDEEL